MVWYNRVASLVKRRNALQSFIWRLFLDIRELYDIALEASKQSYSPYSNFPVGAALLTEDGTVITGANIENRSFGVTNCAERTALFTAVTKGYRTFKAIAIATPTADYPVSPCGICRQALTEFAPPELPVTFGNAKDSLVHTTLGELFTYDALHELKK